MKPSDPVSSIPKVSVCITTYNHERWIAQAIESVLSQRTNFPFEILIGEDDSGDGTREIVLDYANRFPAIIRAFFNDRKDVVYVDGFATGRWNLINNLKNARGEYVALLDGDDYWCDQEKLQRQVDILDANSGYAICFHDAAIEEPDGRIVLDYLTKNVETVTRLRDLAHGNYIHTPTCMYRRKNLVDLPSWLWETRIGDFPLHMLNAEHGSIYRIHRVMAVYRRTGFGVLSSINTTGRVEAWFQTLAILSDKFAGEVANTIRKNLLETAVWLLSKYLDGGEADKAQALLAVLTKHAPMSVAKIMVQHSELQPAFNRLCSHPLSGTLISLLRFAKRDPSFGRLLGKSFRD